ncbi:Squalene/phytoene synthase [Candidatus Bilamarchaeum dharawalense]|uniref:Squalene/phytoene synthase n=1 Tax=Candidatus Bilamarchaeum dharawalense TaxID=2885759 RepID=A0A5E4LSC2_9ARCH|nr:Squalene/phytoene synthase [Candidatus Bilamarchaeum dharawalense]
MSDAGLPKVDFKYADNSIRVGSKTFYFASRFMSEDRRNSFYAIYAFCRHTDNLIDDNEGNPKLQKLLIKDWRKRLLEAHDKGYSTDPILNPFIHIMKKNNIPLRYPLELIRGVSMDISKKEYGTFRELRKYCFRVASVVGLMLMHVMGIENIKKAKKYATKLGIAMQLTNILRDVGEDAKMGRVYFPKDELAKFGLSIQDILSLQKTTNVIDFLKFQVARARKYYREAMAGLAMIHREVRVVIALALSLYREILGVIEENEYEVFTKRAYVSLFRKVMIYIKIVLFGYSNPALA